MDNKDGPQRRHGGLPVPIRRPGSRRGVAPVEGTGPVGVSNTFRQYRERGSGRGLRRQPGGLPVIARAARPARPAARCPARPAAPARRSTAARPGPGHGRPPRHRATRQCRLPRLNAAILKLDARFCPAPWAWRSTAQAAAGRPWRTRPRRAAPTKRHHRHRLVERQRHRGQHQRQHRQRAQQRPRDAGPPCVRRGYCR